MTDETEYDIIVRRETKEICSRCGDHATAYVEVWSEYSRYWRCLCPACQDYEAFCRRAWRALLCPFWLPFYLLKKACRMPYAIYRTQWEKSHHSEENTLLRPVEPPIKQSARR